jgi:hypothetical protein
MNRGLLRERDGGGLRRDALPVSIDFDHRPVLRAAQAWPSGSPSALMPFRSGAEQRE